MHDNRVNTHQLHQHHIGSKTVLQGRFGHSVAAIFDDHRGAMKAADVWQSLSQYLARHVVFGFGHLAVRASRECCWLLDLQKCQ